MGKVNKKHTHTKQTNKGQVAHPLFLLAPLKRFTSYEYISHAIAYTRKTRAGTTMRCKYVSTVPTSPSFGRWHEQTRAFVTTRSPNLIHSVVSTRTGLYVWLIDSSRLAFFPCNRRNYCDTTSQPLCGPIKCQSRSWSQRGTKVNGSHHGDKSDQLGSKSRQNPCHTKGPIKREHRKRIGVRTMSFRTYGHDLSDHTDQPVKKVANPARGQLNSFFFFLPVPVRAWQFGLARRVRQPRPAPSCSFSILHTQAESGMPQLA